MHPQIVKQGAVAVVAVTLASTLAWLVKFIVTNIGEDIDFPHPPRRHRLHEVTWTPAVAPCGISENAV